MLCKWTEAFSLHHILRMIFWTSNPPYPCAVRHYCVRKDGRGRKNLCTRKLLCTLRFQRKMPYLLFRIFKVGKKVVHFSCCQTFVEFHELLKHSVPSKIVKSSSFIVRRQASELSHSRRTALCFWDVMNLTRKQMFQALFNNTVTYAQKVMLLDDT